MFGLKNTVRFAAVGAAFTFVGATSSMPAWSAVPANLPPGLDPAHHSLDINDPDPAHHRPYFVCSASTQTCVLTPVPGFTLAGTRAANPPTSNRPVILPPGYSQDPAHHSTDLNDPDPAHHQPTLEFDEETGTFILTPIPGFDLNGFRVNTSVPTPSDPGNGNPDNGNPGNGGGNPGNGNGNGNGGGNPGNGGGNGIGNPGNGNPNRPFFR